MFYQLILYLMIILKSVTEYNTADCTYKALVHLKKGKACVAICGLTYPTGDDRLPNDTSFQVKY